MTCIQVASKSSTKRLWPSFCAFTSAINRPQFTVGSKVQIHSACPSKCLSIVSVTTDLMVFVCIAWSPSRTHIEQIGREICAEHLILSVKTPCLLPPVWPLKGHFRSDIATVFAVVHVFLRLCMNNSLSQAAGTLCFWVQV